MYLFVYMYVCAFVYCNFCGFLHSRHSWNLQGYYLVAQRCAWGVACHTYILITMRQRLIMPKCVCVASAGKLASMWHVARSILQGLRWQEVGFFSCFDSILYFLSNETPHTFNGKVKLGMYFCDFFQKAVCQNHNFTQNIKNNSNGLKKLLWDCKASNRCSLKVLKTFSSKPISLH